MPSLSFIVGLVGNVISIFVFASPMYLPFIELLMFAESLAVWFFVCTRMIESSPTFSKTFRAIIKKKAVEDFKAIPYITTLLSASLWIFYGILHTDGLLICTINGAGAALEIIYITLFIIYAPKDKRISTMKLVAVLDIGVLTVAVCVVMLAVHGRLRLTIVGVLCDALTICMYISPLAIMRTVIRTKSVEYMPFLLSFFLIMNSGVWIVYAVLTRDIYIGVPNALGFLLSAAQLILYGIYFKYNRTSSPVKDEEEAVNGDENTLN